MRLFAFILSIFLLGLSVVPCADEARPDSTEISILNADGDHDPESDDDHCSPFCVCQCCHSHFVVNHVSYPNLISIHNMVEITVYLAFFSKGCLDSILQPPQG